MPSIVGLIWETSGHEVSDWMSSQWWVSDSQQGPPRWSSGVSSAHCSPSRTGALHCPTSHTTPAPPRVYTQHTQRNITERGTGLGPLKQVIGILRAVEALRTFVGVTCVKSVEVGIKYAAISWSVVGRGWNVPVNLVRVQLGRSVGGGGCFDEYSRWNIFNVSCSPKLLRLNAKLYA